MRLLLLGAAVTLAAGLASPIRAQTQDVLKTQEAVKIWPRHGAWQTTLVQRPTGGYMCMLNGFGQEPHSFGVAFMELPEHLMFMVDDRRSNMGYQPTMTIMIDGDPYETFEAFNDPPMTATETHAARKVRLMIERMAQGQMMSIDARHTRYTLSLDGFADAAGQFSACKLDAARLRQETTGRGN